MTGVYLPAARKADAVPRRPFGSPASCRHGSDGEGMAGGSARCFRRLDVEAPGVVWIPGGGVRWLEAGIGS